MSCSVRSRTSDGSPSSSSATSQLVPPMSSVIAFRIPASDASARLATTPPLGPESSSVTGSSAARFGEITPPFDCITHSVAFSFQSRTASSSRLR